MFGRVRAASSSPESLEMDRPPSNKFLKHHSLSIYETTLMKLREGSRVSTNAGTTPTESMTDDPGSGDRAVLPDEDAMILDPDSVTSGHSTSSPKVVPAGGSPSSGVSIVYLFHRYNSAHSELGSPLSDDAVLRPVPLTDCGQAVEIRRLLTRGKQGS